MPPQAEPAAKTAKKKNGNPDCNDPEGKCPPKEKSKDPYKVDRGQVTFDAEGEEGGPNHSRYAQWPGNSASGVTLGRGYDMGNRSVETVYNDLTAAGIPSDVAKQYSQGATLKGSDAGAWVKKNRDNIAQITPEQQKALFENEYLEVEKDVKRISSKDDTVKKYGAVCWDNLNPKIKESIIDLRFRGDYTTGSRRFLQKAVADNDEAAFKKAFTDRSNWGSVPSGRLKAREAYWK